MTTEPHPRQRSMEISLEVIETIQKIAQAVEHRRAGGPTWKITVEVDGERTASIERDVRGLRVVFVDDATREVASRAAA